MYGRILGFQRLARCPKWTPASIKSFTWTMATHCPPFPFWGFVRRENNPMVQHSTPPSWKKGGKSYRTSRKGQGQRFLRKKKCCRTFRIPGRKRQRGLKRRSCNLCRSGGDRRDCDSAGGGPSLACPPCGGAGGAFCR